MQKYNTPELIRNQEIEIPIFFPQINKYLFKVFKA